jgi:hypothetical protein
MNYSEALQKAIHEKRRICRKGWNGKNMYVFYVDDYEIYSPYTEGKPLLPFLAMKTATGEIVPWVASQTDMLANDWMVYEDSSYYASEVKVNA